MRNSRWRRYEDKMRLAVVEKNNFSNFCKSLHYHHQILKSSNCFSRFSLSMRDSSKSKYQLLSPQITDGCFCFQFWLFYQLSVYFSHDPRQYKTEGEKKEREASEKNTRCHGQPQLMSRKTRQLGDRNNLGQWCVNLYFIFEVVKVEWGGLPQNNNSLYHYKEKISVKCWTHELGYHIMNIQSHDWIFTMDMLVLSSDLDSEQDKSVWEKETKILH